MIDGTFIFDNVVHVYDMSDNNLREDEDTSVLAREHMASINTGVRSPGNSHYPMRHRFSPKEIHDMIFVDGNVDLAMAQAVPIFEWYKDWFAPLDLNYQFAQEYPDKVLFCGGVDPIFHGADGAVKEIERQVKDMNARSFKFYNAHLRGGWKCDDEEVAYPMYRKMLELGINVAQFHKGSPFGQQNMEELQCYDLQKAARDFPEMNFLIHHLAVPYQDQAFNIAARFPNVYLVASGVFNISLIAPAIVAGWMGRVMSEVGSDKVLWGSEAPFHGSPDVYIKHFLSLQVPEELQDGYGMPPMELSDKQKILGLNFAKMMGIEVPARGVVSL